MGRCGWFGMVTLALALACGGGGGGSPAPSAPPAPTPQAPAITGFQPSDGPAGTQVTITGTAFTGTLAVTFNGTPAPGFTVASDTRITVAVPSGATSGMVSLTTPGGTATSATGFTVSASAASGALLYPGGQILPASTTSPRSFKVGGAASAWTAVSNTADWLAVTSGSSGTGAGVVGYQAAPNPGTSPRTGTITAAGQTFTVWQDGTQARVHPRLWVNPLETAKLRSWATSANPAYQLGMLPLLDQATTDYDQQFFPGGVQNATWPDPGDAQGYVGLMTEQYAFVFAFHALIDPDPAARIRHAQRARDLIMVPMNLAALGPLADAPFRDPAFPIYNRAGLSSELWPLIVDWIYGATDATGAPILTAQDKATLRTVFLSWAEACLKASTTGGDHPEPIGTLNDPKLLPPFSPLDPTNALSLPPSAYRMAANNYYLAHSRLLTLMALVLDPADDPVLTPGTPAATLGNTLGSYLADATGAWLYQEYAMYGEPDAVRSAYGLPPASSVGLASGGLPPEGLLYGISYGSMFGQLLALKTAGLDDAALGGPQMALITTPAWGRFVPGLLSSLVPQAQVPPDATYLGPLFQMFSYGDLEEFYITNDFSYPIGLLGLLDQQNGDLSRLPAERWFMTNALMGGAGALWERVSNPWTWGVQDGMIYYMMLDPAAAAPADPRPGYATTFYDAPLGRVVAHTDWTDQASIFAYLANWQSINHQDADAGQFEFYRKGEWLTKEASNYSQTEAGQASLWHNTLSLQNWCSAGTPPGLDWAAAFWQYGSQWPLGMSAGDPVTVVSSGAGYTYAQSDLTALYNLPDYWTPANGAMDVQEASRSILWIQPDTVVVYDRATTQHPGLFKQFNLNFITQPAVSGNLLTATSAGGQNLYVQTLLPAAPAFTWVPVDATLALALEEPTTGHIVIQDPTLPSDARFLNVLQGADAGVAPLAAQAFKDATGEAFDGVVAGRVAVLFPIVRGTVPATLTWTVPATVQGTVLTGLTAGGGYDVRSSAGAGDLTFTLISGSASTADAGGVLVLGALVP